MFEVRVGKMMFKETFHANKRNMELYELIPLENFSNDEFAIAGKELMSNIDLFIAFMDYINMEDYSSLSSKCLIKVFSIVDNIVSEKECYYFDTTDSIYKSVYSYDNTELGLKCWSYVSNNPIYSEIYQSIKEDDIQLFTTIGLRIKNRKEVITEIEDYNIMETDHIKDDVLQDIIEAINKAIREVKPNIKLQNTYNINLNYTSEELGKMAWEFVYVDFSKYLLLDKEEVNFVYDNVKSIWLNIDDNVKAEISQYLINGKIEDFDGYSKIKEEIEKSLDELLLEKLDIKFKDNKWIKIL